MSYTYITKNGAYTLLLSTPAPQVSRIPKSTSVGNEAEVVHMLPRNCLLKVKSICTFFKSTGEDVTLSTIDLLSAHTGCPCYRCRRETFACLSHPAHYSSELFL